MELDIHKYDNNTFHKDALVNNKIKALLLLFDYEVYTHELTLANQIILIDYWISSFEEAELFEVIPTFKMKQLEILGIDNIKEISWSAKISLKLTNLVLKLKNKLKLLFNAR